MVERKRRSERSSSKAAHYPEELKAQKQGVTIDACTDLEAMLVDTAAVPTTILD